MVTESGDEQPPIETCLQEIEDTPKLSYQLRRQLRKLARIKDESCIAPWKDRIETVMQRSVPQRPAYVTGDEISGLELHEFSNEPRLSPCLRCNLCDAGFLDERSYVKHVTSVHGPYEEYRKRVLFKMEQRGPRSITGEENKNHGAKLQPLPATFSAKFWRKLVLERRASATIRSSLRHMCDVGLERTSVQA